MFTLDVIARTEFSVDLEQHDPNNPFIQNALDLTNSFSAANFTFLIASKLLLFEKDAWCFPAFCIPIKKIIQHFAISLLQCSFPFW